MLEHFYNREKEKKFVKDSFNKEEPTFNRSQRIINFFGLPGSGKTWFVEWLAQEYQAQKHTACSLLKACDFQGSAAITPEILLRNVLEELAAQAGYIPSAGTSLSAQSTRQELEACLHNFLQTLQEQGDYKVLVLIDDYEQFPAEFRKMLEHALLWKLGKYPFTLTVLTNRLNELTLKLKPIFQYQKSLSIQTHRRELTNFTDQDISGRYEKYAALVPQILRITRGLPICVEHLIERLQQRNFTTHSEFMQHEQEFVRLNYESPIKDRVLAGVRPDRQDEICILSIPRRFNLSVMGALLPQILPDRYQQYTEINYLNLAESLGDPSLWDCAKNAYAIREPVRRILSYYMALLDPPKFAEINAMLLAAYTQYINTAAFKVHDQGEYLYYQLNRLRLANRAETPKETIAQQFFAQVEQVFAQCRAKQASTDELNELKMLLEGDEDIKEYLSADTLNFMEQTVQAAAAKDSGNTGKGDNHG